MASVSCEFTLGPLSTSHYMNLMIGFVDSSFVDEIDLDTHLVGSEKRNRQNERAFSMQGVQLNYLLSSLSDDMSSGPGTRN